MRAKASYLDVETDGVEAAGRFRTLNLALRMWKLGVLAAFAAVIATWLLVNDSGDRVVSAVGSDVISVSSGNWSSGGTWSSGSAPRTGDRIVISSGHTVIFDANTVVDGVEIRGKLEFSRSVHTLLESSDNIVVRSGGELIVGLPDEPIPPNITATIAFNVSSNTGWSGNTGFDPSDTGLWVLDGGRWESHGAPVLVPWTDLASDARSGATQVIAEGNLTDWPAGSTVLLTATGRNISTAYGVNDFFTEDEERGIVSVQDLGNGTSSVTLDRALTFNHSGSASAQGEIALLTRNVIVSSRSSARAHTIYMNGSSGAPWFTLFKHMGPDVEHRYPLNFFQMGETSIGKTVRGNVIWDSMNKIAVIHNSIGIEMEDNIGYRSVGGGFRLLDKGSGTLGPKPMDNVFIHNLAVKITGEDLQGRRVSAFEAQRENHFLGNTAVSVAGNGDSAGYHWPEAHIQSSGQVFVQNESHSNLIHGMFGWQNSGEFHIVEPLMWRNLENGVKWGAYSNGVQFHRLESFGNGEANFWSRNNHPLIHDSHLYGETAFRTDHGLFIDFYTLAPTPNNPGRTYGTVLENHDVADIDHLSKKTCSNDADCIPTFNAIANSQLLSDTKIRFGTDWETRNPFFDVRGWQDGDGLPDNFRVTRPDQPKPSASAFYYAPFDAWVDPENRDAASRKLPPTISWVSTPSSIGAGPALFSAQASGFTSDEGGIEFFVDELEQRQPWQAEYFSNSNLSGSPVVVTEKFELDFLLGAEPEDRDLSLKSTKNISPYLTLTPKGNWSARFTREFNLQTGGTFVFDIEANDGVKVWVDGNKIVDAWRERSTCCTTESTREVYLSAGQHNVVVEFFTSTNDRALLSVKMHRELSGDTLSDSFVFDPATWKNRREIRVYARAHDPVTKMFAYTPVLKFDNPYFDLATVEPTSESTLPAPAPSPTRAPSPTEAPLPTTAPEPTATVPVFESPGEPDAGLLVLYEFNDGGGTVVADSSGSGSPFDLRIADPAKVTWIPGAIRIDSPTIISSGLSASTLSETVRSTGELTVEAWVRSSDPSLGGPARIVTLSGDTLNRNFTVGQHGRDFDVRLRTSETNKNGIPSTASARNLVTTNLTHVAYTRTASGRMALFVDGVAVASTSDDGDLSNWSDSFQLALGNELIGDRPWLGELHMVAIYDHALSASEVIDNFASGSEVQTVDPKPEPTPAPPSAATPTPEPSRTPEPTAVPTVKPTATPQPIATPTPVPTATPIPSPTPVPTATPTATPVPPTATPTPVPTATPVPPTATPTPVPTATPIPVLRIADLDRTSQNLRRFWAAHLLVTVIDGEGDPVANAFVSGRWLGTTGEASCTTSSLGVCMLSTDAILKRVGSVTWEVDQLSHSGYRYESDFNFDPDDDSDGSTIVVPKP